MNKKINLAVSLFLVSFLFSGCSTFQKARKADELNFELEMLKKKMAKLGKEKDAEIERLKMEKESELEKLRQQKDEEIGRLHSDKEQEVKRVADSKTRELTDLERAMLELEKSLKSEINDYKAKLNMTERGLVMTFLSEIFFDSGKENIKSEGEEALTKVAQVLNTTVSQLKIAVEGHTDNEPIKYSNWKSNWELSCARALAVVHYFIDNGQVLPERLSAVGYGEFRPVQSNETLEGRQQNRRVEIIILPPNLQKVK